MPKERNKADGYREKAPIKREKSDVLTLPSVRCLDRRSRLTRATLRLPTSN